MKSACLILFINVNSKLVDSYVSRQTIVESHPVLRDDPASASATSGGSIADDFISAGDIRKSKHNKAEQKPLHHNLAAGPTGVARDRTNETAADGSSKSAGVSKLETEMKTSLLMGDHDFRARAERLSETADEFSKSLSVPITCKFVFLVCNTSGHVNSLTYSRRL